MSGEKPSYLKLLRDRSFGSLWLGQVVSQSGDAVFDVTLLWLVLVTTGSAALVGATQAAVLIPSVLVGPLAGVYADRLNRRIIMIWSNLAQGAVTALMSLLYLTGELSFPLLTFFVLLLFAGAQFFRAALNAIIPRIVSKENLGAANGLFTLSTSANQLAGYAIGGIALATIGAAVSITYDSLTFFFAAAMMTFIVKSYGEPLESSPETPRATQSYWKDFKLGLAYVRQNRVFLELIVLGLIVNFFGAGVATVIAPYVSFWLKGDSLAYGFMLASLAFGTIVGSIATGKMNFRAYVGKLLLFGVISTGLLIAFGGLVSTLPEGLAVFFGIGAFSGMINLPIQVLVQTQVPGELLGRAVTVMGSLLVAAQPIAAITFGWLAGSVSVGLLFEVAGLVVVIITAVLSIPFTELRNAKY
jgi:DHA3 family macrolide efflux protein-like MFS transporter